MLSKPVYEALPALYVGAGLLSLAVLDTGIKYFSALLLITAGLLVWSWRRQARAGRARVAARRAPARSS